MAHLPRTERHEFALFYELLTTAHRVMDGQILLYDRHIAHRIVRVLRLRVGDTCVLFDARQAMRVVLAEQEPTLMVRIIQRWEIAAMKPCITLWLSLLERDAFEQAIINAAAFGVTTITPLITQKTKRKLISASDRERLTRLMIASCEQSKQLMIPHLSEPSYLAEVSIPEHLVVLDAAGDPDPTLFQKWSGLAAITCVVGPEGDFVQEEIDWLSSQGAVRLCLGASVLRSEVAATVALGLIRHYASGS